MQNINSSEELDRLVTSCLPQATRQWLLDKIEIITNQKSTRDFYLTYSLLASKVPGTPVEYSSDTKLAKYLYKQEATCREMARVFLLKNVLNTDESFFTPHVSKIIQVADTSEMATFLKYLELLPNPEQFKLVAVDALRTNVATVFDALALHNTYPANYLDDKQWNQMFLKAAFMQRPLHKIAQVEVRANEDLSRIISDYAHERWAAGRDIDPYFWRPVGAFLNDPLLEDMKRLFESTNHKEKEAAALCCSESENKKAKELLATHPELKEKVDNNIINWNTIHN